MRIVYPNLYLDSVSDLKLEMLQQNGIKGLILDVDNTLINTKKELAFGVLDWCNSLKEAGIAFCILSNTNKKEKVKKVAGTLEIPYLYFAKKPLKFGFLKAKKILDLEEKQIAVVGDQIFTDIVGANRSNMFSVLVKPLETKDLLITRIKRPFENYIIKRYLRRNEK